MKTGKFPNGLKAAMTAANIGPTALGKLVGENKQDISRWANQDRRLQPEDAAKLAPHLGRTAAELLLIEEEVPVELQEKERGLRTVIVAAHVQAGYWAETWEWSDDEKYEVAVPADPQFDGFTLFAAECRGPSMNKKYPEGTVVVFTNAMETEESPVAGKRYVVERKRANGDLEHTVKLLHRDEMGAFWLVPESTDPLYQEPISVSAGAKNGDEVRIVGRVRYAVSRE